MFDPRKNIEAANMLNDVFREAKLVNNKKMLTPLKNEKE